MGYCLEPPCLVYPLMKRYSLFRNLHDEDFMKVKHIIICLLVEWASLFDMQDKEAIDWMQRAKILKDSACGLVYLHSEKPAVIHHDINSLVLA